jgi:hypothetical protein
MIEVQWSDIDPESGSKRMLAAERFPRGWRFKFKIHRRDPWTFPLSPTREMWEYLLDAMERRYQRRDGIEDSDLDEVRGILKKFRDKPSA